jgi:sulfate permease, SulP family
MTLYASKAKEYLRHTLRFDLVAGLTVAMVALPQAMAYAAIAGVNPVYGIYTAIVPTVVGALTGSSSFLVTGPSNASSLVTYGVISQESNDPLLLLELVFLLAIFSGVIKLVLGLLRMGGITRFISNSVLTGFLGAIGILITFEQFGNLFGITIPKNQGVLAILLETIRKLPEINLLVVATAAASLAFMLVMRRINRRLPAAMLAILFASLLVLIFDWHAAGVKVVADLKLPENPGLAVHLPQAPLQSLPDLLPTAGAVALFSLVEAMSIARALSLTSGAKIDPSREFIGQGLASIAGGLMQCIPSSGSPSRSAVNYNAGAKTRLAAAFSGGFVWLMLVIFANWIGYIPMPGLAAVVVVSAISLIDVKQITLTWNTRHISRVVMAATFAATLFLPLHLAIYFGVLLTVLIHLYETSHLRLNYLVINETGQVAEKPMEALYQDCPQIAVINVEGDLFFGAVSELEAAFDRCQQVGVKVLVLRLRRTRMLASTGVIALQGICMAARKAGTIILLSGVSPQIRSILESSKVAQFIGEERIFEHTEILFEATRRAVDAAKELVKSEGE